LIGGIEVALNTLIDQILKHQKEVNVTSITCVFKIIIDLRGRK